MWLFIAFLTLISGLFFVMHQLQLLIKAVEDNHSILMDLWEVSRKRR